MTTASVSVAMVQTTALPTRRPDAASPTQAHVVSLRAAWASLSAAVTAAKGSVPSTADVQVIFNVALSRNQLRAALDAAYKTIADGSDNLSS